MMKYIVVGLHEVNILLIFSFGGGGCKNGAKPDPRFKCGRDQNIALPTLRLIPRSER